MRAKDPAIGMGFVNDNVFEVGEEVAPVGMMRQDARMEHIRLDKTIWAFLRIAGGVIRYLHRRLQRFVMCVVVE